MSIVFVPKTLLVNMRGNILFVVLLYVSCQRTAALWGNRFLDKYEYNLGYMLYGMSWYDARAKCMSEGGDLVTIESRKEDEHIGKIPDSRLQYWIGLNHLSGEWRWADGRESDLPLDLMWNADGDPHMDELCTKKVSMRGGNGTFYSENCGDHHSYICKRLIDNSSPKTPAPTENIGGYCPSGYISAGNNRCYKFVPLNSEEGVSWEEAKTACKKSDYPSATLACITSEQELAMVTAMLGAYNSSLEFYLGLFKEYLTEWIWTDNSPNSITHWAEGVDTGGRFVAYGFAAYGQNPAGSWNYVENCDFKKGYICQVLKDPSRVISTPPPTSPTSCIEGFTPYLKGCYKTVESSTWDSGRGLCVEEGADLADIHDLLENTALKFSLLNNNIEKAWTGLRFIKDKGEFRWTTGWYVNFVQWGPDQPKDDDEAGCVALHDDGYWYSTDCKEKLPTLCKTTSAPPVTHPPDMPGRCPNKDWEEIGGHCYRFYTKQDDDGEWMDQEARCYSFHHKAKLTSIHNDVINHIIQQRLFKTLGLYRNAWIGLHRKSETSPWLWTDGTPLQYENWKEGGPDQTKLCVYMDPKSGEWASETCSYHKAFVCKMDKVVPPSIPPVEEGRCPGSEWTQSGMMCYLNRPDDYLTWFSALEQCEKIGGPRASLSSISGLTENDIIHHAMYHASRQPVDKEFWIGYARQGPESPYAWTDGSNSSFTLWGMDEPSDDVGSGHCAAVRMDTNFWYSQHCDRPLGYVCKVPAERIENGGNQLFAPVPLLLIGSLSTVLFML